MSYASEHPVTCMQDGCPASFPGSKFAAMKASAEGWFFPREHQGLKGWCPGHLPEWVAGWRARQRAGRSLTIAPGMGDLTFIDAAFMPSPLPDADGFCFYIGGDTPHVYTTAEVAQLEAKYAYLLPVFVASAPSQGAAASDVVAAVVRLRQVGAPAGCLVAWDSETSIDPAYVREVYDGLVLAGYKLIDYGSQAFVLGNDNPDGYYWGADWTNVLHLQAGDVMTQYVAFSGYDESLAEPGLPFWDTRGPVPDPPPDIPAWQEAMMNALPTLQKGAKDSAGQVQFVHRVQALAGGIGQWNSLGTVTAVTEDGDFGESTEAAVKRIQEFFGLTQDGIVGPITWGVLVAG